MEPTSREKTALVAYSGLYQFTKMPFRQVNAPATFKRLIEVVLAGLAGKTCVVYLHDILVIGRDLEEHNANLQTVLERLQKAGLPLKCQFACMQVKHLGHVVSGEGVKTDPRKVEAMEKFPPPTDVNTLHSFLGLAASYRCFVPNFAKVAGPQHVLTKNGTPFLWTQQCQQAFESLNNLLISTLVLAFATFEQPFILETDASGTGLGAVLAQRQDDITIRLIAYASRSLQPPERKYGVTEMEGLGAI